ncbi:MAG: 3-deoxy-7-phosphoheptulonate synthase [Oscillospiraceae bacterium]|nr:3-deoxy-7-phosphoheptulonate synthase [Oscillospiraceae bacterium]
MIIENELILSKRDNHPQDTVVRIGNTAIGDGGFTVIAGPCTVDDRETLLLTAEKVKEAGARILRGGAFKPRTSPYAFSGLREKGIKFLASARALTGLPVVSEITDVSQLESFESIDVLQIGARNMQNYELLRALGKIKKPVLLKRGFANTVSELLYSAEYILAGGNPNVILCERGIRTFETETRFTLDLCAVPILKEMTHLPVIIDPSHAAGKSDFVAPFAAAAKAIGADGLIIEVHISPECAKCDGAQALTPEQFALLMKRLDGIPKFEK